MDKYRRGYRDLIGGDTSKNFGGDTGTTILGEGKGTKKWEDAAREK